MVVVRCCQFLQEKATAFFFFFLLRSVFRLKADRSQMTMSHRSFTDSALTFSVISWYQSPEVKQQNGLNQAGNVCGKMSASTNETLLELNHKTKPIFTELFYTSFL